ncbi:methyl-accepting chemotaxis protein [Geobacter sp. DSM 9736]|uniref:methyl-accepting chemotaxis protein n=1 Tax=Geobacter sp. DSM 9736 TaxID=1277350 RepID=UPI000B61B8EC|nr:methyl-accepting chemotaxis protein [Geobacter sp. DSM 9736]SNB44782.1 Methyl-accepting chemotaxis protein [Geobacter sp. DSM 9736]
MIQAAKRIVDEEQERFEDPAPGWVARLSQASLLLKGLSGSTEAEFLAMGERLHDFHSRAARILDMSNEVVCLVAGDDVIQSIDGLQDILRIMEEYMGRADHEANEGSSTFTAILDRLEKVSQPLAGFKKINKSLSVLGISTKIESARLGQSAAGFDTLANDVAKLSVQVIEKSDTINKQKEELCAVIRQTLLKLVDMSVSQRRSIRESLEKTSGSLGVLNDVNARCASAASVISGVSAEVAQSIGEVVTSLQFHDISRQQIEHVQEALEELIPRLQQEGASRELIKETGDVCELQEAQLAHARDELLGAVRSIVINLQAIASQEAHLSDRTRDIAGVVDQADSSFFASMEADMSLVGGALDRSAADNRELATAMTQVSGTVGNIARFVGDIENIGEEIELIALNAQIKAARTGSDGAALGVLAEAIQRLSHDTRLHTTVVSETLRSITDFIEGLCSGVNDDASQMEAQVGEMVADLKRLLQSLRAINENLYSLLTRMDAEVQALSGDIECATRNITVSESVLGVLAEAIETLHGVLTEARKLIPADSRSGERLRELASRYTMHSERKIHAAVAGSAFAAAAAPTAEAAGEFGENVELF